MTVKLRKLLILAICSVMAFCIGGTILSAKNAFQYASAETTTNDFTMKQGASVRLNDPVGIRFSACLTESKYKEIIDGENFKQDVSVGMIVVPEKYFNDYKDQTEVSDYYQYFNQVKGQMHDLPFNVDQIVKEGNLYVFNGAIVNIAEANYNLAFQAVAYIKTGDTYEYSALSDARSVSQVATAAISDNTSANRLTVDQAKTLADAYNISYKQITVPEDILVKTTDGKTLPNDARFLEDTEVILEFNYGYNKEVVVKDGETTIATAVGPVTLKYPVTTNVNLTATTTNISSYSYGATQSDGTTNVSGTLEIDGDGFVDVPNGLKWIANHNVVTWQNGQNFNHIVSFEMKVSDLEKIAADAKLMKEMGVSLGNNAFKVGISAVTVSGDNYSLTPFVSNTGTFTKTQEWLVNKNSETFIMSFVTEKFSGNKQLTADVYLNGGKVGTVTAGGTQIDSRFGFWMDTLNSTETDCLDYRFSYCVSNYSVVPKQKVSLTVANGLTVSKNGNAVTENDDIYCGDELTITCNYGYNKQVVVKDGENVIATAVGPVTLKYPVTGNVNLTVGTTDISSYSYSANGSTGTFSIKDDGFISVPTSLQWGTGYTADYTLGQSAKRSVSFEMKTSDLAKIVNSTNKITNIGIIFGSNALKVGISNAEESGSNYKLTAFANGGTVNQTTDWLVSSSLETMKLTFVSTISTEKDVITVYLNGQSVGTITPTNSVDGRFGIWTDTRGASETVEYRHSYCVSNYVVV